MVKSFVRYLSVQYNNLFPKRTRPRTLQYNRVQNVCACLRTCYSKEPNAYKYIIEEGLCIGGYCTVRFLAFLSTDIVPHSRTIKL